MIISLSSDFHLQGSGDSFGVFCRHCASSQLQLDWPSSTFWAACNGHNGYHCVMLACVVCCVSVGVRLLGEVTGSRSSSDQKVVGRGRSRDAKASSVILPPDASPHSPHRVLRSASSLRRHGGPLTQRFHVFIIMRQPHTHSWWKHSWAKCRQGGMNWVRLVNGVHVLERHQNNLNIIYLDVLLSDFLPPPMWHDGGCRLVILCAGQTHVWKELSCIHTKSSAAT